MLDTIPTESEDDMNSSGDDTSVNSENSDVDHGDDADGEDNGNDSDDGEDNGNDADDDDYVPPSNVTIEQTDWTRVRRNGTQHPSQRPSNMKPNADQNPVLKLKDRPLGLDPRMTEGDFQMVTNRKITPFSTDL